MIDLADILELEKEIESMRIWMAQKYCEEHKMDGRERMSKKDYLSLYSLLNVKAELCLKKR